MSSFMPKNVSTREIRVFLSSTFKDMDEERRYLVEHVFPQVRQACAHRQVVFTEIDLRWGITEEETKNGRTVEICLEEIDRSRNSPPFFIGFLGERYGWIPTQQDLHDYQQTHADSRYVERITQALKEQISVTELEMQYAFLDEGLDKNHARIFLRDRALTDQLYQQELAGLNEQDVYDPANGKLEALKNKLRASEHAVIGIDGYTSIEAFGEAVKDFLMESLDRLYPDQERTALERYLDSQAIYAQSRLSGYLPLAEFSQQVLQAIYQIQVDNQVRHLHIYGESGLGKSAFLAHLAKQLEQQNAVVLSHFVGAEALSSPEGWRDQIVMRLRSQLEQEPNEGLDANKDAWESFYDLLAQYQQEVQKPVFLLLDALNQMQGPTKLYQDFSALKLPENVYFISSAIESYPLAITHNASIPRLQPKDIEGITRIYLADYQKTLPPDVVALLVDSEACQNGLFLKTLLEELRVLGRHETLLEQAQRLIALQTPAKLFQQVLKDIDGYQGQLGLPAELAKQMMQFIGLSYRGLTPHQLKLLLTLATNQTIHDAYLAPILARLQTFLLNERGRYRLMHSAFQMDCCTNTLQQRESITKVSDKEVIDGLLEQLFQATQMKQLNRINNLLGEYFLTVFEADQLLFRDALTIINAGAAKQTLEVQQLISNLKELKVNVESTLQLISVGSFLFSNSFLNLAELLFSKALENSLLGEGLKNFSMSLKNLMACYYLQGRYDEIRSLIDHSLESLQEKSVITADEDFADIYGMLALAYRKKGQYEEAVFQLQGVLKIWQTLVSDNHPNFANTYNALASVYKDQGQFDKAECFIKKALDIRQSSFQEGHLDIAHSFSLLANLYMKIGRTEDAEKLLDNALEIKRLHLHKGHPDILNTLSSKARLYEAQGYFDKSLLLLKKIVHLSKLTLPEKHPDIANRLEQVGIFFEDQGDLDEAEESFKEALEIRQFALSEGHPDIVTNLNNLAMVYEKKGRLDEAEQLLKQALELIPEENNNKCNVLDNLGMVYEQKEEFDNAAKYFKRSLEIRQLTQKENFLDISRSLNNLAIIYLRLNKFYDAEPLLKKALELWRAAPPEAYYDIACDLNNIAKIYYSQGLYDEAKTFFQNVIDFQLLAEPQPGYEIVSYINQIATIFYNQGCFDQAEPFYKQSLKLVQAMQPENHIDIINNLNSLAELYVAKKNFEKAEKVYKEVLTILSSVLPAGDPDIAATMRNLSILNFKKGSFIDAEHFMIEQLTEKLSFGIEGLELQEDLHFLLKIYQAMGLDNPEEQANETYKNIKKNIQ